MFNVRHDKETITKQLPACLYGIRCEEAVDSRCLIRRKRDYRSWWNRVIFTSGKRMGRDMGERQKCRCADEEGVDEYLKLEWCEIIQAWKESGI